ncbi:MAG: phosphate/phosphite/phosphonate ABC transporter substrate-binding protein [Ignavibacteriales bacterium CG12_big_fil_rev_8_21_14_0_65_30_8]|nr:MAG: phosphate/phosphite/phosphonate ABC transporter substrate-binding protein [Ignavibacteriales bacterium CG12_big_fil_rev_8_21_14_0_65_30_8]
MKYLIYLLPLLIFIVVSSVRELNEGALGTRSNPVKIYFTPSVDAKRISFNAKELTDFLEKETGYYYITAVPASFVAVVEAFGSGKADIASINTFSYLMANYKYGTEARLRIVRDGDETSYRGQIITRVDSGIDNLSEIDGRKMAYVDPSSTSGYILPKALLDRNDIHPGETAFAMRHDNVVTMVYQKQVDAGATYSAPPDPETGEILDARMRVLKQFPDVAEKIKIIGYTERIPNDPWVFRKDMPEKMKDKIVEAILKYVKTPAGAKALYDIYDIRGLIKTVDSDYDGLRALLKKENISFEKILKKK